MLGKYSQQKDGSYVDYDRICHLVDCLETISGASNVLDELLKATSVCHNPTKRMQSLTDQISIMTQSLIPKMAKLNNIASQYKIEFQKECHHKWSNPDEYETGVGGDEYGTRVARVKMCELCGKIE